MMQRHAVLFVVIVLSLTGSSTRVQGQMHQMDQPPGTPPPVRITMDQLHAQGGVPHGWKFSMPRGDVAEGRRVFVAMECFACHDVEGEDFPHDSKRVRDAGPALTGMGATIPRSTSQSRS